MMTNDQMNDTCLFNGCLHMIVFMRDVLAVKNNIYFGFEKVSKSSFSTVVIIFNITIGHFNMIACSRTLYIPLNLLQIRFTYTEKKN